MATVLPTETPQFAFYDRTEFNAKLKAKAFPPGSIIVGGENFGCGSSREQACSTLKGHEVAVVARSISRIFLQNSINLGLQVVICPDIEASEGDEVEITADQVLNRTTGKAFEQVRLPAARKGIMDAGGLIPYTRARLMAKA
jgi:3-isopropylmalate/(R)-2-methylmalate dehydratase small subunit